MTFDGVAQSADDIRNDIKQELSADNNMKEFITQSLEAGDYSFFDTTKTEVAAVALKTLGKMEQKIGRILEKYQQKGLDIDPGQMAKRTDGKISDGDTTAFGSIFLAWKKDIAHIENQRQTYMIAEFTKVLLQYWNDSIDTTMQKVDDSLCGLEEDITQKIQTNESLTSKKAAYSVENIDGVSAITFSSASNHIRVDEVLTMSDENGNPFYHEGDIITIDYSSKVSGTFDEISYVKKAGLDGTGPFELQYGKDNKGNMTLCLVKDGERTHFRGLISDGVTVNIHPDFGTLRQEVRKTTQENDAETRGYADILEGFPPAITTGLNLSEEENKTMMIGMDNMIISAMDGLWSDRVNNKRLLNEDTPFSSSMLSGVLMEAHTTGEDGSDYAPDFITEDMLKRYMGDALGTKVYTEIDSTMGFGGHLEEFTNFLKNRWFSYKETMEDKEVVVGIDDNGQEITEKVGGFENFVEGLDINLGSPANAAFMKQQLDRELQNIVEQIEDGSIVRPESATPFSLNGGITGHLIDFETSGGLGGLIDAHVLSSAYGKLIPGQEIPTEGVDLAQLFTLIDHGRDDKNTILVRNYLNEKWGEVYYNTLEDETTMDFGFFNGSIDKPDFEQLNTAASIQSEIAGLIAILKEVADDASLNEEEKNKLKIVESWIEDGMNKYGEIVLQSFIDGQSSGEDDDSDACLLHDILIQSPPQGETDRASRHRQTRDQIGLVSDFLLSHPDEYLQERGQLQGYLALNEKYFAVASTLGGTGAEGSFLGINTYDSDDLENLLQSGNEENMQHMIDSVPAVLSKIEMENSDPQQRAKAMVDYYNERQARIENNGSQSSEYEHLANEIMKTIGSQVSDKIQGYIQSKQQSQVTDDTPTPLMDLPLVRQLKRVTDIMRDNRNIENNLDTRNTFKDIDQAEANLEFLMTAPGGGIDQMTELKPVDQETESVASRTAVQSTFSTLIGGEESAAQFSHIPGWDESMFTAPYQDLTVQQRVVVAGLHNLSERYNAAELQDMKETHGIEAVISSLMDIMNQTSNQMFADFQTDLSAWYGGGADDAGLSNDWDDIFDSYKSLHGVGRLVASDENMTKIKGYAEMLGTIVVAVALAVVTLGVATEGSALLVANGIRNLVSALVAAGKASAITSGVLTGIYMKVVGMGLGHGYETYTEGLTDIAAEGVMMGVISAATLGVGTLLGKFGGFLKLSERLKETPFKELSSTEQQGLLKLYGQKTIDKASRFATRGPRTQTAYTALEKGTLFASTNLLFVGGMDLKQKFMTDDYMTEEELTHALMEGMVLAFLMPYLHGKKGGGLLEPLGGNKLTAKGYNALRAKVEGMIERTLNGKDATALSPSAKAWYTGLKVLQNKLIGNYQGTPKLNEQTEKTTPPENGESVSWEVQQGNLAGELLTGVDLAFNVPDRSLLPKELRTFADGRTRPTKAQIEAVQNRIGLEGSAIDGVFGPETLIKLKEYLQGPYLKTSLITITNRIEVANKKHAELLTQKESLELALEAFNQPAPSSQFTERFNQRQSIQRELAQVIVQLKKSARTLSKAKRNLTTHEELLATSTEAARLPTKEQVVEKESVAIEERVEQQQMEQTLDSKEITTQTESVSFLRGLLTKLQSRGNLTGTQATTLRQKLNNYIIRLKAKYPNLTKALNDAIEGIKSLLNKTILRRRTRLRTQSTYSLSLFSLWETLAQVNSNILTSSMRQFRDATKPSQLSQTLVKTIQSEIGLRGKNVDGVIGPKTQAQWENYLVEAQITYNQAEVLAKQRTQEQQAVVPEEVIVVEEVQKPVEREVAKAKEVVKVKVSPEQLAEKATVENNANRLIVEIKESMQSAGRKTLSHISDSIAKISEFLTNLKEGTRNFMRDMLALLRNLTSRLNRRIATAQTGTVLKLTGEIGGVVETTFVQKLANGRWETIRSTNTNLLGAVNRLSVTSSGKFQLGERTPTEGSWNISFVRNNLQASQRVNSVQTIDALLAHENVKSNPEIVRIIEEYYETGDATQLNELANNNIIAKAKQLYKKSQSAILQADQTNNNLALKLDQLFGNQKTKTIDGVEVAREKVKDFITTKDVTGFVKLYGNKGALNTLVESMHYEIVSQISTTSGMINYISTNMQVLASNRGINGIINKINSGRDISNSLQQLPVTLWSSITTRLPQIKQLEINQWNETVASIKTNQDLVTHWQTGKDIFIRHNQPSRTRLNQINQTILEIETAGANSLTASVNNSMIEGLRLAA